MKARVQVYRFWRHLKHFSAKWIKKIRISLIIVLFLIALLFTVVRALTPWAKQYKGELEQHLSALLGQPVTIHDLETSWYWFHPVLKMDQITLSDSEHHVIHLKKLWVGINVLSSLWQQHLQPGVLYVDDVHLTLRQTHHRWDVDGLNATSTARPLAVERKLYEPVLAWVLSQQKIILKRVSADVYLSNGTLLKFGTLNFTSVRSQGHYRLSGRAQLSQSTPTECSLVADVTLDPSHLEKISGQVYVSMQHVLPTQWQPFFPKTAYQIQRGEGHAESWLTLDAGQLTAIQTRVHLKPLYWTHDGDAKQHVLASLNANVAWSRTGQGWHVSADQLDFTLDGLAWPENVFSLDYKRSQQAYHGFLKTLTLRPLLKMDLPWPEDVVTWLRLHPKGTLHDLQWRYQAGHVVSLLTRFSALSWGATDDYPAVRDLSGALYWQPDEGRLELDGQNTVIAPKNQKPLTFGMINAAFNWKALSDGLRITMDRLVLSHPHLLISAEGALDQALSEPDRQVRLSAEFYAKNAEDLLKYLPTKGLKPKLLEWLQHEIKKIGKASGRLLVKGKCAAFPFDHDEGVFTLHGHVSGVDLFINKSWPLNQDVDADISVNKRMFEANIDHAVLAGVPIEQVNLGIHDIGLGQEILLIHGHVMTSAANMKNYVFTSPLRSRLNKLRLLDLNDPIDLDLSLDIPLYVEREQVYANGLLTFDQNPGVIHGLSSDVQVDGLSGQLQFNEHGLTEGRLTGRIAGAPITLQAESLTTPEPHTQVSIQGTTTLAELSKTFVMPMDPLMQGSLKLESVLTLYDDPSKPELLHLSSSLEGVSIALPAPYGKSAEDLAPLVVDAVFRRDEAIDVHVNYKETLDGALLLRPSSAGIVLKQGEVRVGGGVATLPERSGLRVVGSVPSFNWDAWRRVLLKQKASSSNMMDRVRSVVLDIGQATLLGNVYEHIKINASQIDPNDWLVNVNQKKLVAQLHYHLKEHLLSGHVQSLWLDKPQADKKTTSNAKSNLKPLDIPNVDLTVDEFKWGAVSVGQLSLKGHHTPTHWLLDEAHIESPEYALDMIGDWEKKEAINRTTLDATLQIQDLAKSLERWSVTPAVHAHKGTITFKGDWPRGFADFSLANCTGDLNMVLKNGRINHFDKETEEKLGLGRLLSILSLQTIPRRLKLDFSDLSEDGYTFDVFKGSFQLRKGIMSTQDSYVDGPVAYANMKGDLDVVRHLYDMDLRVSPYITASLPVVATIAGGPVAGIATWFASNIINKGMQKISGYTYKITGPWLDPVVQQVSIDRHKKNEG